MNSPSPRWPTESSRRRAHDAMGVSSSVRVGGGVTSLLDLSDAEWQQRCGRPPGEARGGLRARSDFFLLYARGMVETLRDGSGWEAEYPRDVWRLNRLPGLRHCVVGVDLAEVAAACRRSERIAAYVAEHRGAQEGGEGPAAVRGGDDRAAAGGLSADPCGQRGPGIRGGGGRLAETWPPPRSAGRPAGRCRR